ncbi:hypothetical protein KUV57_13210 [Epibacterium sp. DP7N7-1]|nr:hypothetical protein [Epibacterium sp. DP7N7-1]
MATKFVARAKKAQESRPGGRANLAKKYAKLSLLVFAFLCAFGVGLLLTEISTPGMAWYTYE